MRSENGLDFLKPGLKTGMGNGIFRSEIGSGFGDAGGTHPSKISTSTPPPPGGSMRQKEDITGLASNYMYFQVRDITFIPFYMCLATK